MAKTELLAIAPPASRPLKNSKHEKYCRLRAALQPRAQAYREAGWNTSSDDGAYSHACRLERRPGVKARIEFLSRQDEELIAQKRRRIEEKLWLALEADFGDCFETYEVAKIDKGGSMETDAAGKMKTVRKQRPKLINDLPPDLRKVISDVTVDRFGNYTPKLCSRTDATAQLCKLLNFGAQESRPASDVSKLSDAELVAQLSEQANQLGVKIDLNYSLLQQQKPDDERQG
jgi:Terminase small subunit